MDELRIVPSVFDISFPSGEVALAEDQANSVLYLLSPLADKVSGVVLPVDSEYAAGKFQEG